MTKVYIVIGGWHWDTYDILGVYADIDLAEKAIEHYKSINLYDYIYNEEYNIINSL
jgi:hypothetical protein